MKFEEDHVLNKKKSVFTVDNPSSTELDPSSSNANKRPTFSDFVHKLRQQSTRTRFVNKKLANASDEEEMKDQDPSLDTNDNIKSIPDSQIEHLDISTNIKEKKPGKRVTIVVDESSEEEEEQSDIVTIGGKHVFIEDIQPDRFITMKEAIELTEKDVVDIMNAIEYQSKRIEIAKEEISFYTSSLNSVDEQMEINLQMIKSSLKNNIPEMKSHQANIRENKEKMKYNRKRNLMQKARFDKYRKVINIETRLFELEKKIKVAWKRDEISAGIRDWGFLSILVICLIAASLTAWKSI